MLLVQSVIDGYNGTVMAYGQTGTGKTFTIGRVGREDPSECGIMVRALEDILAATSLTSDTIAVSYLQVIFFAITLKKQFLNHPNPHCFLSTLSHVYDL